MAEDAQKRTRAAPQAGPRTTLIDLWRGDLSEVVAAFLPLESIATVPRISRRFLSDGPLSAVRAWVDANSPASRAWAHGFELVSNFPRFVASADNAATTIAAAGLAPQVTFMVKEGAAPQ